MDLQLNDIVTTDYISYQGMSLRVADNITLPIAQVVFDRIYRTYDWSQFYVGDMLVALNAKFGEDFAQIVDPEKYSPKTLQRFAYVASRIPPENRREELSYSMHVEVAKLDAESQGQWLDMAIADKMTIEDLREAMGTKKTPKEKEPKTHKLLVQCPDCEHKFDIEVDV